MISLTLSFPSMSRMIAFVTAGQLAADKLIDPADDPSTGRPDRAPMGGPILVPVTASPSIASAVPMAVVPLAVAPSADNPAAAFAAVTGVAVAPAPLPLAPSIAVAAPSSTAPAAPQGTSIVASAPAPIVPPLAPLAAAPAASAALTSPVGVVDSKGLPWDERIHAQNKATNADGSWRQKRGLNDPVLKATVEAELRARMGGTVAPTNVPVAPVLTAVALAAPAAVAPAAPVPPAAPAAPVAPAGPETFSTLVTKIVKGGFMGKPELDAALAEFGISAFGELAVAGQADPTVFARFATRLGI